MIMKKMIFMASSVNKTNMARNRIAVHPFGYKKNNNSTRKFRIFGKPFHMIQSIKIKNTFDNIIGIKNIIHCMDNKPRKGRTLADMVYESYKA